MSEIEKLQLVINNRGFELVDGDRLISFYRTNEELPREESPKPCFAPIYTPSGRLVTEYRPADHAWHTGLYFGWVHVNDANLWGGEWHVPESGKYELVIGTHGIQRHDRFRNMQSGVGSVAITEDLTWLDQADVPMVREERQYRFETVPDVAGYVWSIRTEISSIGEKTTIEASKANGYSGLVLRMGPPFAPAIHRSSEGLLGHETIMGTRGRWVSADGAGGGSVLMMDHPQNPRHPITWFTRTNLLGTGMLMDDSIEIRYGEPLVLIYGLAILDQNIDDASAEKLYSRFVKSAPD